MPKTETRLNFHSVQNQEIAGRFVANHVIMLGTSIITDLLECGKLDYCDFEHTQYYYETLSDGDFEGNESERDEKVEDLETRITEIHESIETATDERDDLELDLTYDDFDENPELKETKQKRIAELNSEIEKLEKELENADNDKDLLELAEPNENDVFEYWFVSDYLYRQLKDRGETVLDSAYGYVWGRGTTGQAIKIDGVITSIISSGENFAGQKYGPEIEND